MRTRVAMVAAAWTSALFACGAPEPAPTPDRSEPSHYEAPATCGGCHPDHYRQWRGSAMHYAAVSPVFNAFELTIRSLSEGLVGADGAAPNFCSRCHSPPADRAGELPADLETPARDAMSPVSNEGISCDFCHSATAPALDESTTGDGIANLALEFAPSATKRGPIEDPRPGDAHDARATDFLSSSEFCGACHDVRLPMPDLRTGEPFLRVEDLFSEWAGSAFAFENNRYGRVVSCQDCHMSLFPLTEPGVYPTAKIAVGEDLPERRHTLHAFTAVSIPLIDDPRFDNRDTPELDRFGYPLGQAQRRRQMLRAACEVEVEVPAAVPDDAEQFRVAVTVENVGAGHRVPSGFSQERQVWLHIEVHDTQGLIYESGYLRDRSHPETGETEPDGRLHDEELEGTRHVIDPVTFDDEAVPGPDVDLVTFTNAFLRRGPDGEWHDVVNPLAAQSVDNSRSLAPGVPRTSWYRIQPGRRLVGAIRVQVRLRYRALPPELMRALAQRHPELVTEAMVDENRIVDMAEAEAEIPLTE